MALKRYRLAGCVEIEMKITIIKDKKRIGRKHKQESMTVEVDDKSIKTVIDTVKDLSNKFFGTINHAFHMSSLWDAIDKILKQ